MKQIILASTSPRRKEVMDKIGIPYTIIVGTFEEQHELHSDPVEMVEDFAEKKAQDVLVKHSEAIVIGGDTMVVSWDGKILGKPKHREDAFAMMQKQQGNIVKIYTGVAVISSEKTLVGHAEASVLFRPMNNEQINEYLDRPDADWMDKAGAFGVQGTAKEWISEIKGEWSAILGLSEELTRNFLEEHTVTL